jgi:hypothetical protein
MPYQEERRRSGFLEAGYFRAPRTAYGICALTCRKAHNATDGDKHDRHRCQTGGFKSNGKTGLSDAFRTHFAGDAPITEKATNFAKARPWTSAAFLGVAAIAVMNSLRGRG